MATKKIPDRTYVSLSFSCPPQMERLINQRTVELGFHSRSDYLRTLFERDLTLAGLTTQAVRPTAPPRIRRGRKKKPAQDKLASTSSRTD